MKAAENDLLLSVKGLTKQFSTRHGVVTAVDDVSFTVCESETVALVGESGCGKSISSLAIMGMLPEPGGTLLSGTIRFRNEDIFSLDQAGLNALRGDKISMLSLIHISEPTRRS